MTRFGFHALVPWSIGEGGEQCVGVGVEVDAVASFGLRGRQHGAVGAFNPAGAERDPHRVVFDVVPPQRQQLCASCAGGRGQHQQQVQHRVAISDVSQQCVQLDRGRRMELSGCDRDAVGSFGGVVPHPSPSHRVGECRSDHDMHPRQRAPASGRPFSPPRRRSVAHMSSISDVVVPPTRCDPRCGCR